MAGLQLLAVARPVIEAYQRRKQELGLLDFDDLLIRADDLLAVAHNADLRRRVAAGIELLLVDEFQDTDPLQVSLVKALCGERLTRGKLFFVGDHKQSIYRFRGAEPRVFRQLREEMAADGRLPLSRNFRSQPAILHFVNALFESELGAGIRSRWSPDRNAGGPRAGDRVPVGRRRGRGRRRSGRRVSRLREREADWIARRLRAIIDSGEKLVYEKAGRCRMPNPRPGPLSRAILRSCSAPCPTCSITKPRCGVTDWSITSSEVMPSTPSRKCSISSTCCERLPAQPTRSAWPACCAVRSSHSMTKRCSGSRSMSKA